MSKALTTDKNNVSKQQSSSTVLPVQPSLNPNQLQTLYWRLIGAEVSKKSLGTVCFYLEKKYQIAKFNIWMGTSLPE